MTTAILDKEKYKAAFLYMLEHLGKIEGRKKACKLFYFLDFDYYEAYEKPFTGETYVAFPMGPVPEKFREIEEEMEREGLISTYQRKMSPTHDNLTTFYKPETSVDYPFTEQERKMLDRIIRKYGASTGKELEDITHCQAPYNAVDLREAIPYEYTFYRETSDLLV
jgi:uncharacterized phage-associated protein